MQRSDFVRDDGRVFVYRSVRGDNESWFLVWDLLVGDIVEPINCSSAWEVISVDNNLITLRCTEGSVVSFPIYEEHLMTTHSLDESTSLLQQFRDLLSSAQAQIEDYNINSQTANDLMLIIQSKFIDLLLRNGVQNHEPE